MREIAVCVQIDNEGVTPIQTIDAIKKVGFNQVFIAWYNRKMQVSQEEQLKYIKQLGLDVIFAHLGYEEMNAIWEEGVAGDKLVKRYENDIQKCKENDIPMVVMHLQKGKNPPIYNELGLKRLKKITDYAKKLDIKVAFENTRKKEYLEYVLDRIKEAHVGICYDAGHCHAYSKDEFDYEKFKNRIFAVHLHDNDGSLDQHLLPFDGTIDWKYVTKKLEECNYNGPITLELCYRNEYSQISIEQFYQKGYEAGKKLESMIV